MTKKIKEKKEQFIRIRHDKYVVRKSADKESEVVCKVAIGDEIKYNGRICKGWYNVTVDGKKGWIYGQAGDIVETQTNTVTIKKSAALREMPNSKSKKIITLDPSFAVIDLAEKQNGWMKVKFDKYEGWISEKAI